MQFKLESQFSLELEGKLFIGDGAEKQFCRNILAWDGINGGE